MQSIRSIVAFVATIAAVACFQQSYAQQFTAGRLVVERVGNASIVPSTAGSPIYLDEYTTAGIRGISLALPTVNASPVNRTVESGIAPSCGMMTRSANGAYIAVPGYDAAVGTAALGSSPQNKVVTRVDGSGNLASTVLTDASAFPSSSFRSVATNDGNEYWLSGDGNGPVYVAHTGSTTPVAGTQVSATNTNNRNILIAGGQLYQSSGSGPNAVYSVGSGLPVTSGNTMTVDVSLDSSADPYAFVIVNNGGTNVMYITDNANQKLYKYYLSGSTWIAAGSVTVTVSGRATGFYGLTGYSPGSGLVNLFATTVSPSGAVSSVVAFTDISRGTATISGSIAATTIVGPTSNESIHGIAFVPFSVSGIAAADSSLCAGAGTTITISGNPNTLVTYSINGVTQPPVTMSIGGIYSFSTGTLSSNTTYEVISATDGIMTQTYAMSLTVTVNPLPDIFAVTGGGAYCSGGAGVPIGLLSSQPGIAYQLYVASSPVGIPDTGTGIAVSFGLQRTGGLYTVKGADPSTGCYVYMTDSALVTVDSVPQPDTMTGGGGFCAGGTGVAVGVTYSQTSMQYQLYRNGIAVGSSVPGDGTALSFGMQTVPGIYTVVATDPAGGCTTSATDSATVQVYPVPAVATVFGGGSYCWGGAGLPVGLSGSDTGVLYKLYNMDTTVADTLIGTGDTLSFGLQARDGYYHVSAYTTYGCSAMMSDTVSIYYIPDSTPSVSIFAMNPVCHGTVDTFHALPANGGSSPVYTWYLNGTLADSGAVYVHTPAPGDSVMVMMVSNVTCPDTNNVTTAVSITVLPDIVPTVTINVTPRSAAIVHGSEASFAVSSRNSGATPRYEWLLNGRTIPGATDSVWASYSLLDSDIIACLVYGCSDTPGFASVTITVYSNAGVGAINRQSENIRILPNPNRGAFTLTGDLPSADGDLSLAITDMVGNVIFTTNVTAGNGKLEAPVTLPPATSPGVYVLTLRGREGVYVARVVIE